MIRPLQARLENILVSRRDVVTTLARRVGRPLRSIMVTGRTSRCHARHLRVARMVKRDRQIQVFQFV